MDINKLFMIKKKKQKNSCVYSTMDLKDVLHMKYDDAEFSYAHNCTIQEKIFTRMNRPMVENAIKSLISDKVIKPSQVLKIADLGCGIGPIASNLISLVTTAVSKKCKELKMKDNQVPEIQIFLSDLPTNDFNSLFRSLEGFQLLEQDVKRPSCFVVGVPGSFYGRLFPRNSLHFVHSNYALQWLSQVPLGVYDEEGKSKNKGSISVSETSPSDVVQSYRSQYQQDFNLFLRCRANEVVPNGYMLLALKGSPSMEPQESCTTKLLYQALASLVSKGLIHEKKLDSFALPLYFPAKEEIQIAVTNDKLFTIEKLEQIVNYASDEIEDKKAKAEAIAKTIRAFAEAVVSHHFGRKVWNELFNELTQVILNHLNNAPVDGFSIIILLRKNSVILAPIV